MQITQWKVYINRLRHLNELKENTIQEIRNLTPDIIRKDLENAVQGTRLCLNNNGGHLEDIILEKNSACWSAAHVQPVSRLQLLLSNAH